MQIFAALLTPNIMVEFVCLVGALWLLRRDTDPAWRIHRWYLAVVVGVEFTGAFLHHQLGVSNHWLYNGFILVEILFVSGFIFFLIRQVVVLHWCWAAVWLLFCYGHYSYEMLTTGITWYLHGTVNLLGIGMVAGCMYYFIIRLQHIADAELRQSAGFWWAYGTFFFYSTGTIIALFFPWIARPDQQLWGVPLAKLAQYAINIITYSLWTYSYYLRYQRPTMT